MTLHHGTHAHAPTPHPYEYRGTRTCNRCGCNWKMYDLSAPNPKEDLCYEPVTWHPKKCLCHSQPYVDGLLDERDRMTEEQLNYTAPEPAPELPEWRVE